MSVSIALCTYNGGRFLKQQLQSLLAQTRPPDELVVGDDGSSDETLTLLAEFAEVAPFPVRLTRNPSRLGYRENFVRTAGRCTGELILFCDQDDVWFAGKIRTSIDAFNSPEILLVYHDAEVIDATGQLRGRLYRAVDERRALATKPMPPQHSSYGFTQAFRRELLRFDDLWSSSRDHFSAHPFAHDQWYMFLALALGQVRFLDIPLARYLQHGANAFGFVAKQSVGRVIAQFFQHSPLSDSRRAEAASSCASILRQAAERGASGDRTVAAIVNYEAAADRYRRRATLFSAGSIAERQSAFRELIASHSYQGRPWAFDWRSMPRDFFGGVLRIGGGRE